MYEILIPGPISTYKFRSQDVELGREIAHSSTQFLSVYTTQTKNKSKQLKSIDYSKKNKITESYESSVLPLILI